MRVRVRVRARVRVRVRIRVSISRLASSTFHTIAAHTLSLLPSVLFWEDKTRYFSRGVVDISNSTTLTLRS